MRKQREAGEECAPSLQRQFQHPKDGGLEQTAGGRGVLAAKRRTPNLFDFLSFNHVFCIVHSLQKYICSSSYDLPVDDFFTLGPYEVLFLRGEDAQRVLLTRPGFTINDIGALVHIDRTLGQSAGLKDHNNQTQTMSPGRKWPDMFVKSSICPNRKKIH